MIGFFQRKCFFTQSQLLWSRASSFFFSKKVIVDLKKFREENASTEQKIEPIKWKRDNQISSQPEEEISQIKQKIKIEGEIIKPQVEGKEQNDKFQNQYEKRSKKETRSRQLSSQIMKCSTEKELWKIFGKNNIQLESQHLVMLFYSQLKLRKFRTIFDKHKKDDDQSSEFDSIWDNKKFQQLAENIQANIEDMNPDSINLLLKALTLKKFAGGPSQVPKSLFAEVFKLLLKDQNILLFNELQLFYFLKNISSLKSYLNTCGDTKGNGKVVQLALSKIAPHLIHFKRNQLFALTIVSLNLGLFESQFHLKLNQGVLKKFQYLKSTDFILLFQYNTLYYLQNMSKNFNKDKEEEKLEILNRILYYMDKKDVLPTANFKNIIKLLAFFYQMNFKPTKEAQLSQQLQILLIEKFSDFITHSQQKKGIEAKDSPILLKDAFMYLLKYPQIFLGNNKGCKFFQNIRILAAMEDISPMQSVQIAHFVVECFSRENILIDRSSLEDLNNVFMKIIEVVAQKLNGKYNETDFTDLEEIIELLAKIKQNELFKLHLSSSTQDDLEKILLKSTKYLCQVTYKLETPSLIKIGEMMKFLLKSSPSAEQRCRKYLHRYAFSEFFSNYEGAIKFGEIKEKFHEKLKSSSSLKDVGIDELAFNNDISQIESQIIKRQKDLKDKQNAPDSLKLLELPSLKMASKIEKYQEFQEVIRRQTHILNGLVLYQIAFSNDNLILEDKLGVYNMIVELLQNQFIVELLTIDNINNLIIASQIYQLNSLQLFQACPQMESLADQRLATLRKYFETRKKQTRQQTIEFIQKKNKVEIKSIEECVQLNHCLIDIVITTASNQKIAIISALKAFDPSENRKGFDSHEVKTGYLTKLRQKYLTLCGFDQVYAIDNRNFEVFINIK